MITQNRNALLLAVSLAALAGFVDALGFLKLGGFFISFMSGNSTRFAVSAAELGYAAAAIIPLSVIVLFVLGVMAGVFIQHFFPRKPAAAVLVFATAALLLAAMFNQAGIPALSIALMVLAMGAENNVFVKGGEVNTGVTYMTGALVRFGQRLARGFLGQPKQESLPYLFLWLGLVTGAVLGTFSYSFIGLQSLWIAAACAALILITMKLGSDKN